MTTSKRRFTLFLTLALAVSAVGCPVIPGEELDGGSLAPGVSSDGGAHAVENAPPIAHAGDDLLVVVGELVALNGSQSDDPDGDMLSFWWAFSDLPVGSAAALSRQDVGNPTFTPDRAGRYVVKLSVDDGVDASQPDAVEVEAVARSRPLASAGADASLLLGQTHTLDASASAASAGGALEYRWRVLEQPSDAAPALAGAETEAATFTPDALGSYLIELIVSEDGLESLPDHAFLSVFEAYEPIERAPVAIIEAPTTVALNTVVEVDGSPSFDPDGGEISYTWALDAPAGSTAAVQPEADATWSFVADVEGLYELSLIVSDGERVSAPAELIVTTTNTGLPPPAGDLTPLALRVSDAEYSRAHDLLVLLTDDARVVTVDIATGTLAEVPLPLGGLAVSVGLDGLGAIVGHDGYVTELTLSPLAVVQTLPVSTICGDVVMGDGFAYCFPSTGQWTKIFNVDLTTAAEEEGPGWSLRHGTRARMHVDGDRMYGADNGLSPSDIERYDIDADGTAGVTRDSPYHGDYAMCGDLWLSDDGARIFTRCGNVFRASNDQSLDMTYNGSIEVPGTIGHADHSSAAGLVAAVPGAPAGWWSDPVDQTDVYLFEDSFLAAQEPVTLPVFPLGAGESAASEGRFVFFSSSGQQLVVVVQAEAESGALFDFGYFVFPLE